MGKEKGSPQKEKQYPGINGWILLLVFSLMLVCVTSVSADYYETDAGNYQLTLTVNPDGSMTGSAAGVIGGTMAPQATDPSSDGTLVRQDLDFNDASYGYATVAANDANGDVVAVDTTLTDALDAYVHQKITTESQSDKVSQGESSFETSGLYARQHVYSDDFGTISANSYAVSADGSSAMVHADASGSYSLPKGAIGGDDGGNMFAVTQYAEAGTVMYRRSSASVASADQRGYIEGVNSANVVASSKAPGGFSSGISAGITDGTLRYYMGASADPVSGNHHLISETSAGDTFLQQA